MGVSASLVLFAIGAILAFAVGIEPRGLDLDAVGVILMIVGGIGFVMSLAFWSSWGGFGAGRRSTYVERTVDDTHHHPVA